MNETELALFKNLDNRIDRIEKKVDALMSFRWQVVGFLAAITLLINLIVGRL